MAAVSCLLCSNSVGECHLAAAPETPDAFRFDDPRKPSRSAK